MHGPGNEANVSMFGPRYNLHSLFFFYTAKSFRTEDNIFFIEVKQATDLWCIDESKVYTSKLVLCGYWPMKYKYPFLYSFLWVQGLFVYLKTRPNQAQILILTSIVSYTYSIFIFDVDNSSFVNKTFHCILIPFTSCNVQGSLLSEKEEQF